MLALAFYLALAALSPLAAGSEPERVNALAVGSTWMALAVSSLLSLELTYGGAASIVAVKRWLTVVAELYGFHDFSTNINAGPLEVDVSAKIGVYPGLTLNAGIYREFNSEYTSTTYKLGADVRW